MKTITLHRTDSNFWRLLADDKVHPLLVGFLTLSSAINKLSYVYDQVGPFSFETLINLAKELRKRAEFFDGDEVFNMDVHNARVSLMVLMLHKYPEESRRINEEQMRSFGVEPFTMLGDKIKSLTEGGFKPGEMIVNSAAVNQPRNQDSVKTYASGLEAVLDQKHQPEQTQDSAEAFDKLSPEAKQEATQNAIALNEPVQVNVTSDFADERVDKIQPDT